MTNTIHVEELRGQIDFAVIAIRHDEYAAVLQRFSPLLTVLEGRQGYQYCCLKRSDGKCVRLVFARASIQGQTAAQGVASKAIADFDPKWLVLIGIAGGVPDSEFSLGDVLLADSFFDFSVTAAKEGKLPEFRTRGGPVHRHVDRLLTELRAWERQLGNWNGADAISVSKPSFEVPNKVSATCYYGSIKHKDSVRKSLKANFPDLASLRQPLVQTGAVGTSNELIKDTRKLERWLSAARQITHIEMEFGGVEWAARTFDPKREIPLLSIRGISDIVGFERISACTLYACHTAASFFHALVADGPLEYFGIDETVIKTEILELPPPTTDEIVAAFRKSSSTLVSRIVKPADRIPRSELWTIDRTLTESEGCPIVFVLGGPGSGKTALLALFAKDAIDKGRITLALKADTLPSDQSFAEWSKSVLGLDLSLIDAVRAVANQAPVLLVIDQLDALSSTVDLTSSRLNAFVGFIEDCLSVPGVSLVCSCRSFDYTHDARFSSLNARVIELSLPAWEDVSTFLTNHGVQNSANWPEDFRELLRNPQHLTVYVSRFESTGKSDPFKSYQLMLDDLWDRLITTQHERNVIYALTSYLTAHEELWAPLVKFEEYRDVLNALESKEILQTQDLRIGFKHQTLLEHAKARLFTKDDKSLCAHVLERQDAVLVRPTVWAVLQYLRDANPVKYRQEIEGLFDAKPRLHIRYLLMEFLGRVSDARDYEVELMGRCLQSDDDRVRALISIRGQAEYFHKLSVSHFPAIMRGPVESQWLIIGVLSDAWSFSREAVLKLIEDNWVNDPAKDSLTWRAMSGLTVWDERAVRIVRTLIQRTNDTGDRLYWAESLVYSVAESQPALAPALFVDTMRRLEANNKNEG